ncbi:MAG: SdpI family protein [Spirochaetales bacterium]|nr:SdpI family protein [Spirochaetales bacterium]
MRFSIRLIPIIIACASLVIIAVSIPLILDKIKPNQLYGFRTPKTLSSEEIWYKANKYSGMVLLITGIFTLISMLVILIIAEKIGMGYTIGFSMILFVVPLSICVMICFNYLGKL